MWQMRQHVLQEPGSAVDPQRRVAYFLLQVVASVTQNKILSLQQIIISEDLIISNKRY